MKTTSPSLDVARERLRNQRLIGAPFATPEEAVGWLGAVQAQDYAGAKWALGQRTKACRDADVEQACRDGRILRTHVMRPTWHFVLPADIRWLLALTAPRVRATMAYYDRQLALDDEVFRRSKKAIAAALAALPDELRARMRLIHYSDLFDTASSVIVPVREGDVLHP